MKNRFEVVVYADHFVIQPSTGDPTVVFADEELGDRLHALCGTSVKKARKKRAPRAPSPETVE